MPSGGEAGQVWTSNGAGAGTWADASSGAKKLYTGDITDLITITSTSITVNQEFNIEYIASRDKMLFSNVTTVKKTVYTGLSGYSVWIGQTMDLRPSSNPSQCYIYCKFGDSEPKIYVTYYTASSSTSTKLDSESVSTYGSSPTVYYYRLYV